jgi:elongation factor Ts
MTITAKQVGELRDRTGAGMMECKKALEASGGDIEAAIEAMRKAGSAKADKKAGRIAAEGLVLVLTSKDGKAAVMVEINCETDFVARDENFKNFAEKVVEIALAARAKSVESLLNLPYAEGVTVEQARAALVAKIGENVQIRRVACIESNDSVASYVHGGRIGVLVELKNGNEQLGRDLAMHIAASNPLVITREEVPADLITKEKEIFSAQAQSSGKPAAVIEKMIEGRVKKYLDEVALLGQPFVKNPDNTISQLLDQTHAKVISFTRFAVGEGIEKPTENFVEAVMEQVRGG